ncbi:MAG: futalosine hydrolase [Peptococcaceae bacterium]|nr:futalosine hydrolase [Peptococcaceae bacterium]
MNPAQTVSPRILIVTAVRAEREAVLRGVQADPRFDVIIGGVGAVAAAANTTRVLVSGRYDLVVCAGIGGGFLGRAELGSLVVANSIVCADLGADSSDGFYSLEELGFGTTKVAVDARLVDSVALALRQAELCVNIGVVLTVSTVTGTPAGAAGLAARVQDATAEAMEGYGVAYAAHTCGIPVLELRAISNVVGPRDRSAWRIKEALQVLTTACVILTEVL